VTFLTLLFAHLLADYPLQGDFLALNKGKNPIALLTHAGIWTGTISVTWFLLGYEVSYMMVASLFIVHTVLDYLKATNKLFYKKFDSLKGGLLLDQLFHVLQIVSLFLFFS
jgi:hypothetical protein